MTSGVFLNKFDVDGTFTVEILDTDGTTVLETINCDDLDDAITFCKRSQARILDGESIQIVVNDSHPNGILAKFKNNSGTIDVIHDATPSNPAPSIDEFFTFAWNGLDITAKYITQRIAGTPRDATNAAAAFLAKPEGKRYLNINRPENTGTPLGWSDIFGHASDAVSFNGKTFLTPFIDNQRATIYAEVKAWAEEVRDQGATIDYLTFDIESNNPKYHFTINNDADNITAIDNDAIANPTTRYGKVLTEMQKYDPTITDFSFLNGNFTANGLRFDGITQRLTAEAYNTAIVKPFREVFPNIKVTSYNDYLMNEDQVNKLVDRNGFAFRKHGVVGDFQCPLLYGRMDNIASDDTTPNTPAWMGTYNKNPWNALRKNVNDMRYCFRISKIPLMPWTNSRSETGQTQPQWQFQPLFWNELQRHIPLYGIRVWNYFNITGRDVTDDAKMDEILAELNNIFGTKKLKSVDISEMAWDSEFIISGAIWNGQTVWRVSVQDGVDSITIDGTPYIIDTANSRGVWHYDTIDKTSLTVVDTT